MISGLLDELVRMLDAAVVPALPITEFEDVREGFRFMTQARHIGKIIVRRALTDTSIRTTAIAPDATYLITGGCGALGLEFAQWLAREGARHLLLVSRHGPDEKAEKVVAKLRDAGIDVRIAEADVSDRGAIDRVIRGIAKSAPLKGVLHAAGVVEDHGLLQQDAASFASVAAPKWQGAWNLHGVTRKLPLDFFVLFSSASVLLGVPGQANYVAANAALDSLAEYRRAQNLPALSVQWGPWSEGMATSTRNDPASFGLGWIIPEDGTSALGKLVAIGSATATVLPVLSWATFFSQRREATAPLFEDFRETAPVRNGLAAKDKPRHGSPFIEQLGRALPIDRRSLLLEHLRMHAARILELPSGAGIDEEAALHDVGLDSLMAVELRNALQVSLRRKLSATLLLDYPTLGTLTDYLTTALFGSETLAAETADDSAFDGSWDRHVKEVGSLTENEAESLLAEELEKLHGSKK
jgi:short-subunit dehydrogenase/acyl carrier protein